MRGERPDNRGADNAFDEIASSHCLLQCSGLRRLTPRGYNYTRDLRPAKWRSVISLHGSNPEPLMSALGQKRTFECAGAMSALPPKADIRRHDWHVRFVPLTDIGTPRRLGVQAYECRFCRNKAGQKFKLRHYLK